MTESNPTHDSIPAPVVSSPKPGLPDAHEFLIKAGTMLHQFGTPSHRLERVLSEVAAMLGIPGTFLYTPTALIISLEQGADEVTYLRRVDSGAVDVDKLIRFDETLERLEAGEVNTQEASRAFDTIAAAPAPFPVYVTILACGVSTAAVAILFRGSLCDVITAGCIGLIITSIDMLQLKLGLERGFLEPLSGFAASVISLGVAHYIVPIDDRLVTLASLIILIPGLGITVALTELAVGHLSAGVARLAGACVSLLTLTIGVALGWRVAAGAWRTLPEAPSWPLEPYWQWIAIFIAPMMFAIVFRARWPQWPTIVGVTVLGYVASLLAGNQFGVEVAAFSGALAVGVASNLYARIRNRPALVPLTPGIIVLVPGSVGYKSLTAFLDHETMAGIDFAFMMVIVAAALVGGILTANAILPPKRTL